VPGHVLCSPSGVRRSVPNSDFIAAVRNVSLLHFSTESYYRMIPAIRGTEKGTSAEMMTRRRIFIGALCTAAMIIGVTKSAHSQDVLIEDGKIREVRPIELETTTTRTARHNHDGANLSIPSAT
jgi:hypothetical protein